MKTLQELNYEGAGIFKHNFWRVLEYRISKSIINHRIEEKTEKENTEPPIAKQSSFSLFSLGEKPSEFCKFIFYSIITIYVIPLSDKITGAIS